MSCKTACMLVLFGPSFICWTLTFSTTGGAFRVVIYMKQLWAVEKLYTVNVSVVKKKKAADHTYFFQ